MSKRFATSLLAAVLSAALFLGVDTTAMVDDTAARLEQVLKDTRAALGGGPFEKATALSAEGEFRRMFGQREMSGDIELRLSGSDKLLWIESMAPTGDPTMRIVRTSGLNGTTTLESVTGASGMMGRFGGGAGGPGGAPGAGAPGAPGANPNDTAEARQARLLRAQQRQVTRLMLALLLRSDGPIPLEFSYGGEADSDDGKADVIIVKGPDAFAAQLFIDKQTHLPMVLAFRDVQQRGFGGRGPDGPGAPGAPPGQPGQAGQAGQPAPTPEQIEQRRAARERARAEPPTVVDVQWFLSDHKKVNGVMLPHTIRRSDNGEVREEWTFKKYTINPVFKPDTFEKK